MSARISGANDPRVIEAVRAVELHGSKADAARALGIPVTTLKSRLQWADVPDGQAEAIALSKLDLSTVRGGWVKTDAEGNVTGHSVRWSAPDKGEDREALLDALIDGLKDGFAGYKRKPTPNPKGCEAGSIALFPHGDWHFGSVVSADVGGNEYNREIAEARLIGGFERLLSKVEPCEVAIIVNNGDASHAGLDGRDETFKSRHRLKVEGTPHENLRRIAAATAYLIDRALEVHGRVIYRANPGNHDPDLPNPLSLALVMKYQNEPRVTIADSEAESWVFQQGKLFVAFHHGHGQPPAKYAPSLPTRFPREFGASEHWFYISSHYHNEQMLSVNGITCIQLPAVTAIDTHGAGLGFADTAAMTAYRFSDCDGLADCYRVNFPRLRGST